MQRRPETGSLNPMAEVGCFSVTKSTQCYWKFSCDQPGGTSSFGKEILNRLIYNDYDGN